MGQTDIDPLVGRLVDGRYQVVSRIARGGMATVYRAVDRRLDRDVALKVMHPHLADATEGGDFVARFRREARTVARLVHPGLVQVFDQGVDGATVYLAMEYVEGVNLRHRIRDQGTPGLESAFEITEKVLEALAVAHRAGLVHRDIKPENVLMASDGRIKLADFGLARAVTELTQASTGTILGTVAYLAPELISEGTSDTRTDVYAVGVLVYEMITGRQPFLGASPVHVAFQHVNNNVPAPSDLVPWLPAEVDEMVAALVAREPSERPVDAFAALALLRRTRAALDPETLQHPVGPIPPPPPTSAEVPEHNADHQETEVVPEPRSRTVALPIGLGLDQKPVPDIPRNPPPPPRSRRGPAKRSLLLVLAVLLVVLVSGTGWWFLLGPGASVAVPSVAGLERQEAADLLSAHHLEATFTEAFHATVPEGKAIGSDPERGTRLARGETVTVVVSKGPDWVDIPEGLVGMAAADAVNAITEAGLLSGQQEETHSDTAPTGTVISVTLQDGADAIEAGRATRGEELTLTVSLGPAPVDVPDLTGKTVDEATTMLTEEALQISISSEWSASVPVDQVISQSPEPGETLHRGDTVSVVVSKGVEMVAVPDVVRTGQVSARKTLEALGFQVEVVHADTYYGLGFVVKQTPAGGTTAPKGSVITLTVT